MKMRFPILALLAVTMGCGVAQAQSLDAKSAGDLMAKAACNACHQIDKKAVGPAYKDVSAKYKGNAKAVELLADKVRKGGMGVWGPIPMPPNPKEKISDEDIKRLVAWILTL